MSTFTAPIPSILPGPLRPARRGLHQLARLGRPVARPRRRGDHAGRERSRAFTTSPARHTFAQHGTYTVTSKAQLLRRQHHGRRHGVTFTITSRPSANTTSGRPRQPPTSPRDRWPSRRFRSLRPRECPACRSRSPRSSTRAAPHPTTDYVAPRLDLRRRRQPRGWPVDRRRLRRSATPTSTT